MKKILGLKCFKCSKETDDKGVFVCPKCGGNLDVVYDYKEIKKSLTKNALAKNIRRDIWRYIDILPLANLNNIPKLTVGGTPLYKTDRFKDFNIPSLYIKDDTHNPSASFKDRASAVAIAHALEGKNKIICGASTGNAAASTACLCAGLGIETNIFVPENAPMAKIAQLLMFGANLYPIKGTYDDAFDFCVKVSKEFGWYNRNTGLNPFTREGKKTCSFEICEQLNYEVPDIVLVPVGDGNIITGIWKGFKDFYNLGLISHLPQLVAVQAEHSNAIQKAFDTGREIQPVSGDTIADSISVSLPRDGEAAVIALKESKGFAILVSDSEITAAQKNLAGKTGIFAEPAGATSFAGLLKGISKTLIDPDLKIVVLVTGSGLKDIKSVMGSVTKPEAIAPDLEVFKRTRS